MHFKRKIVCSAVVAMVLASCATTNDEYQAESCIDCALGNSSPTPTPGATPTPGVTPLIIESVSKASEEITWIKKDLNEEVTQGMALSPENAIVYSKWDNRLQVINPNTQTISDDKLYLDVTGSRYSSGETPLVDSESGASEQVLAKMLINHSGTDVFSMLVKNEDGAKDKGVGIYSDNIANGIPETRFARRATTDIKYYNYPKIRDIALSHDGMTLLACGERVIKIFDATNLNSPTEINTGKKMRSVNFSEDDKYIFAGSGGLSGLIRIYDAESRESISEINIEETPLAIVELAEAKKIVAIFNSKDGAGGNKVRVYDISDISNPKLDKLLVINGNAKSIVISPNGKLFAIAATGKQVNLFSISGVDTPKVITLGENVSGLGFISDTKLIVSNGTCIEYFDITVK